MDFQNLAPFNADYADLIKRFNENAKAVEAGEKHSFTIFAFAPDEYEAEAWKFIESFNALYAGRYCAFVENEDGLIVITISSDVLIMKNMRQRLRNFSSSQPSSTRHSMVGLGAMLKRAARHAFSMRWHRRYH